ncbi:Uncharacterised protein [Enterobacter cloacae]|nr:Uncharacterised protein [Enterobacter cloacae]
MHFLVANKCTVDTHRRGGVRAGIEHITHPQQRLCTALVKDSTRVNFTRHGKRDTGRDVCLNKTGDNVYGRTLRCQHQVDARRTRFLCQTRNQLFHFLANGHHQVGELIHQHHDVRQFFQHRMLGIHAVTRLPVWVRNRTAHTCRLSDFLVITGQVTHAQRRHQLVATLHFIDAPAQCVGGVLHVGHYFR